MSIFDQHKEFYSQPIRLTGEQRQAPIQVFTEFFNDFNLPELRERLADWLECAITSDNDQYAEANQRGGILVLAERLEVLIEAAYLLQLNKK